MDIKIFDDELEGIWNDFELLQYRLSNELEERLNALIKQPKEQLDDESYLKIMFMKGMRYEEQENKNAARYCAMRMLAIQECIANPRKKRPRLLDIKGYTCNEDMLMFIDRYTDFLEDTYKNINRRLAMIIGVLFLVVFVILFLVLDIPFFVAAIESLMIGMFTYLFQKRRMPAMFQKNQLKAIEKYVEETVLEFDRVYRYM